MSAGVQAQVVDAVKGVDPVNQNTSNRMEGVNQVDQLNLRPPTRLEGVNQVDSVSLRTPTRVDGVNQVDPVNLRPRTREENANQFQRFIKETTGRDLPIYGRELFDSPQTYVADPAMPAPDDYILGPGDQVQLKVFGPQDFGDNLIIDRNGQVSIPKAGMLTLSGVAVRDLEKTLKAHLGKVFANFTVSASVGRLRGIQVYVVGQARQPGTFQLSSLSTLVNALFASGGPNANGSMRNIELKRAGKTITTIDLYSFIAKGDKGRDLPLMSGDVIVINSVGPRVAILGAFDQAAIYELKHTGTSVGEILSLGGGIPALASTQKALLERITREKNPPRQVVEMVLDQAGLSKPLQDGDVLTLMGISPAFANAVTLQGAVADPLRYRWFEGMRILDLIPEREALITRDYYKNKNLLVQNTVPVEKAGLTLNARMRGMLNEINWDYAVIERLDRSSLKMQIIPFNLGKVVLQKDLSHNLELLEGDVVTILNQSDLMVSQERQTRLVRVEGEVSAPGIYNTLPGETLPQLIKRIGGLTSGAYVFGTEFTRNSVRLRQQENLNVLVRQLESKLQAGIQSTGNVDNPGQVLSLQQQQATMKEQINRLKNMKSDGRISLELDLNSHSLASIPSITLEDGDRVIIPAVPAFVSVMGAVNNENVFIYNPNKTVGSVLKSAGLTDDADKDQTFMLRADGSILSQKDLGGMFGGGLDSIKLMPGDTVVVPPKLDRESKYSVFVRGVKDWTQIIANLGLGVAAINSLTK